MHENYFYNFDMPEKLYKIKKVNAIAHACHASNNYA